MRGQEREWRGRWGGSEGRERVRGQERERGGEGEGKRGSEGREERVMRTRGEERKGELGWEEGEGGREGGSEGRRERVSWDGEGGQVRVWGLKISHLLTGY